MTKQQFLTETAVRLAKAKKTSKRFLRDSILLLRLFSDHTLETFIIIMFMYEVGFEFTAIDKLMEYNNKLRAWILRKFSSRKKK